MVCDLLQITSLTTKANDYVFESERKDFEDIKSTCDEFMEKNPGSHASAVNDPGNCFNSSTIAFLTKRVELTDRVCFDVLFIFSLSFFHTATVGTCG